MKKFYLLLLTLFAIPALYGQSLSKANRLFKKKAYVEAAQMYAKLGDSQEVLQNLGDSYYYNSEMEPAVEAYNQLFEKYKESVPLEVFFRYAQALKGTGNYEEADRIMSIYADKEYNTKQFEENLTKVVPYSYELKRMTSSTSTGDFGIAFYGDKVVFASLRNSDGKMYEWNDRPYLDLFQATVSEDGELENVEPFSENINTETHESNPTFTADGKTMYFSRTNEKRVKIGDEKVANVKIYKAELLDSVWTNITELPFNNDYYSAVHPALNKENDKLYFSSDMPGGEGSMDLYYVDITESGYGNPVNLGPVINTKHREQFPFVSDDNTLYFASDGHQGFGGLDIFMTRYLAAGWTVPLNLGEPMNSGLDDFAYALNDANDKGYISSNRDGADNLYAIDRTESDIEYTVEGSVRDKITKNLLPNTLVTLYDEADNAVGEVTVGADAKYRFTTRPNRTYRIKGQLNFYATTVEEFKTNDLGTLEYNIELEIISYDDAEDIVVTRDGKRYIELENIYFDLDKWAIKPQAAKTLDILVALLKKYPDMDIQLGAHTDSRASAAYNLDLSQKRAQSALDYLASKGISGSRLRARGFGESQPLVDCKDNCTEVEHSINRRCEFIILK
ncbi:OmpA family protein [Robertkochia solimangrovi]|uniref:OmpA family protein n=1 Tax=Robertkochia solimangrovi TaxID=2213046 RepID=UPI00117D9D28|nr:OmpA family protein [Robertkochia solimangrovi]TRZ41999.1 hypothetical protein DMZ48_15290 [Robertkochia solimangrovi]